MVGGRNNLFERLSKIITLCTTIAILVRASSALKSFNLDMPVMAFGERCSLTRIIAVTVIAQHRKTFGELFRVKDYEKVNIHEK